MKKIIDHMDEKIAGAIKGLDGEFTLPAVIAAFQAAYPRDWSLLEDRLIKGEKNSPFRDWKKGALPTPERYVATAFKEYAKRNSSVIQKVTDDRFTKKK
jgi:hypothetical protein